MRLGKRKLCFFAVIAFVLLIAVFVSCTAWENRFLETAEYTVTQENIPPSFDGFKIAHISDLHNAEFGQNNDDLVNAIRNISPDIIVMTGDMVDSSRTNVDIAVSFVKRASEIAPCYYVTGNHEGRLNCEDIKEKFRQSGVTVLENESVVLERNGECITLIGMDDISVYSNADSSFYSLFTKSALLKLSDTDSYTVLLSHRPEFANEYSACGIDLAFSGHAHGGQFRLPFIGGLYAPGQGFFPKYDSGAYNIKDTVMIVSRGLGNSKIPFRINNRPQIISVCLEGSE
jgi:predicted MPP superfamily phosphohydrolase